jgi:hypothetical protein
VRAPRATPELHAPAVAAPYAPAMTSTTRPAPRLAATALAAGLLLVPLAACKATSDSLSCAGTSCSVTLSGDGASADVFNTTLAFGGVDNGRATLRVGDTEVSCAKGESVDAGPLSLECTEITDDSVKLTASIG